MGESLIAITLLGPKTLDKAKVPAAKAKARETWELLGKLVLADDAAVSDDWHELLQELPEDAQNGIEDPEDVPRIRRRIRDCLTKDTKDAADVPGAFVDEFFAFWREPEARDTTSRLFDKDARKVVAAGASSWGDEPDGAGYAMLLCAAQLGITDLFDIE